ncbi:MAG: exonuclease domain-containing protein [Rectinemataceae bacterium]
MSRRNWPRLSPKEALALLPEGWKGRRFLAIDVETTGLDPRNCRVVEIGALLFEPSCWPKAGIVAGDTLPSSLESLVDPGSPIPAVVTSIHGIGDRDVAGQPGFAELIPELDRLLGQGEDAAIILAHNAPFDLGFLAREYAEAGRACPANRVIDSLTFARAAFPELPSHSLPRVVAFLGIPSGRSHRALDDARAAAAVFMASEKQLHAMI